MEATINGIESQSIGQLVAEDFRTAEVFKKFNIDFCCGGKRTVEEVCQEKGIDLGEVVNSLAAIDQTKADDRANFQTMSLDKLCHHIINTHHTYVLGSIDFLSEIGKKVVQVHGESSPELLEIYHLLNTVFEELHSHMHKEEAILFPYVEQLAVANRFNQTVSPPAFGSIINPISVMEEEHEFAGNALKDIKRLTNDYQPPEHACNSYRVFFAKMEEFENDLHQHVHLENNILFPRAIALEKSFGIG